jgi:DNA-binding transcriptional MerR regulator
MAEVAPYVLRYWETEFPALSEGKEKGAARLYTARDVQIIARIRQLLYDEGFTVAGAKKRLEAEMQEGRFDEGEKAPPIAEQRRRMEEPKPAASTAVSAEPVPRPRPLPAPPPPPPPPPASSAAAPSTAASPTTAAPPTKAGAPPATIAEASPGFPERKAVIKELKEIVRLLERSKKR